MIEVGRCELNGLFWDFKCMRFPLFCLTASWAIVLALLSEVYNSNEEKYFKKTASTGKLKIIDVWE